MPSSILSCMYSYIIIMLYFLKNMCKVLEFLQYERSSSLPLLLSSLLLFLYLCLFKDKLNILSQLSTHDKKIYFLFPSAHHPPSFFRTYPVSLYHVVFLKKCLCSPHYFGLTLGVPMGSQMKISVSFLGPTGQPVPTHLLLY
jgi:hypothetical protein